MPDRVPTIAGFGFSTGGARPDLSDLDQQLARFEATGASHVELSLFELDLIVGGRVLPERRRQLERICSARALQYTVHGALGVNFMDEERLDLHKAVARAMLEVSGALGASAMVQHAGVVAGRSSMEIERLHAIERNALFEIGEVAARHGVRLALENLFIEKLGQYTADPARLAEQIATVDHGSVCGTLDFSHAYIMTTQRGLAFAPAIETFAPYVNHLHLHDSFGRPNTLGRFYTHAEQIAFGIGDIHLPMGWGDIDWEGILPRLRLRPGTVMIVELLPRHWSEIDEVAATARRFVEIVNRAEAGRA